MIQNVTPFTNANRESAPSVTRRLLNESEAAQFIGCSKALLRKQRQNGSTERSKAIPYIRIGGRGVRYDINDLSEWITDRRVVR